MALNEPELFSIKATIIKELTKNIRVRPLGVTRPHLRLVKT